MTLSRRATIRVFKNCCYLYVGVSYPSPRISPISAIDGSYSAAQPEKVGLIRSGAIAQYRLRKEGRDVPRIFATLTGFLCSQTSKPFVVPDIPWTCIRRHLNCNSATLITVSRLSVFRADSSVQLQNWRRSPKNAPETTKGSEFIQKSSYIYGNPVNYASNEPNLTSVCCSVSKITSLKE